MIRYEPILTTIINQQNILNLTTQIQIKNMVIDK